MRLYLVRHGDAEDVSAQGDFGRRLTAKGREQAARLGRFLAAREIRPACCLTSPYARARETAATILAGLPAAWGLTATEEPRLGCGCDGPALRAVLEAVPGAEGGVLVVGHQPDCGEILQYFCGGGQAAFKKCTLAVVELCELRRAGGELLALVPSALQG